MATLTGNPDSGNRCQVDVDSRDGGSDEAVFNYLWSLTGASSSAGEWARLTEPIPHFEIAWLVVGGKYEVSPQAAKVVRAMLYGDRTGESLA